jgi:dTDP-4-dehydrorhamnose reductase/UDP-glucose 4-epimerase
MGEIVVVGRNGFLARRFLALSRSKQLVAISHEDVSRPGVFDNASCVVNFAFDARMQREPYAPERDVDLAIAERIAHQPTRLVVMSTRMVYGQEQACGASEDVPSSGLNQYGINKLETEMRLRDCLAERVTILRIANVLAWEPVSNNSSFMLQVLGRMKRDGKVVYDISPFVRKDFVTERYLVDVIDQASNSVVSGTYNVGSGIPLEVGRVAMWVLEGAGRGDFVVTSPRVHDEFWLDMTKSTAIFGSPPTWDELKHSCIELGKEIARG